MHRYFSIGLLLVIAVAIVAAVSFVYKTVPSTAIAEFAGVSLRLDYATTEATRELGLGGRTNVPKNYGMLFVFPRDDRYGFWMKDTLVPLDMFWLNDKGQVVYIARDVATSTYPGVFYPTSPARYVLETAAGFADAHAVATGTPLELKSFPTVFK
jgi:uncharacterized membrane protein (UPF0127 family)